MFPMWKFFCTRYGQQMFFVHKIMDYPDKIYRFYIDSGAKMKGKPTKFRSETMSFWKFTLAEAKSFLSLTMSLSRSQMFVFRPQSYAIAYTIYNFFLLLILNFGRGFLYKCFLCLSLSPFFTLALLLIISLSHIFHIYLSLSFPFF